MQGGQEMCLVVVLEEAVRHSDGDGLLASGHVELLGRNEVQVMEIGLQVVGTDLDSQNLAKQPP